MDSAVFTGGQHVEAVSDGADFRLILVGCGRDNPTVWEPSFFLNSNKALFVIRHNAIEWDNCAGITGVEEDNPDLWEINSGRDVFYLGLNTPTEAGWGCRNGTGLCKVRVKYL